MVLDGLAVPFDTIDAHWVNGKAAVEELRAGTVDAVFHRGGDAPSTLPKSLQIPNVSAVPIFPREADRIRALHPFVHPVMVGLGTYEKYPAIPTIGVDSVAVCRDDLPEGLVYAVTRAVFQILEGSPHLARGFQRVELRRVQATPIPLHPGAANVLSGKRIVRMSAGASARPLFSNRPLPRGAGMTSRMKSRPLSRVFLTRSRFSPGGQAEAAGAASMCLRAPTGRRVGAARATVAGHFPRSF